MKIWIIAFFVSVVAVLALPPSFTLPMQQRRAVIPYWSPTNVDGLQFWFKGDTIPNITEGSQVSNWINSASQTSWYLTNTVVAEKPKVTNTFNGTANKCLHFDGARVLWVSNSAAFSVTRNTNDCVIVAVARCANNSLGKCLFHISTGAAVGNIRDALLYNTSEGPGVTARSLDGDGSVSVFGAAIPVANATCIYGEIVHTNKVAVSGSVMTVYTNNVQSNTGVGPTSTNTQDTASLGICMGKQGTTALSFWLGEIAEVLVYVPKPSSTDRTNIWNYLKAKYNL